MTTPNITDTMPYGVVMRPAALTNGSSYLFRPVKPHPKLNGFNLRLTPGPVMITASWTGEQSCSLYLRRDGKLNEIAVMPQRSGGGGKVDTTNQTRRNRRRRNLLVHAPRLHRHRPITHRNNGSHPTHPTLTTTAVV